MKRVFQTVLEEGAGNCMAACVASLLEVDIEDVPNFRTTSDPWKSLQDWLGLRGLCAIQVQAIPGLVREMPPVHCIVSGRSPRHKGLHAVVGLNSDDGIRVIHDPNPNGDGSLRTLERVTFIGKLV